MNYKFIIFLISFIVLIKDVNRSSPPKSREPEFKKGLHFTGWTVGSKKFRKYIDDIYRNTTLNTIVIEIKDMNGNVFIPGVKSASEIGSDRPAIKDIKEYVKYLKNAGIYVIARQTVFCDNTLPRKKEYLGIKSKKGGLWKTYKGLTWANQYIKEVWDYNIEISTTAAQIGFDEIQYDYIRFPSDGPLDDCDYGVEHTSTTMIRTIYNFLRMAKEKLKPYNVKISICVFGLTTSRNHMGIGQDFATLAQVVDYISPMIYPSHYGPGVYNIKIPEAQPYEVVKQGVSDGLMKTEIKKMRPYLQAFSLKYRYDVDMIYAQIKACEELGVNNYLFWDPDCKYKEVIKIFAK